MTPRNAAPVTASSPEGRAKIAVRTERQARMRLADVASAIVLWATGTEPVL